MTGRVFFEEVIRENLNIGRPSQPELIFDHRVNKRTPVRFQIRVITEGVVPSLRCDFKSTRIKHYHKEGRALRMENTINNTRDLGIGKLLKNLTVLRQIGFQANRRLVDPPKVSHDCSIWEDAFDKVRPIEVEGQRAAGLRFGDRRVQALSQSWSCSVSNSVGLPIRKYEHYWRNCWDLIQLTISSQG